MNVPSYAFLAFVAIVAVLINVSNQSSWRRAVLLIANLAFVSTFTHDPVQLAPFGALLAFGYAAMKLLESYKRRTLFIALLLGLVQKGVLPLSRLIEAMTSAPARVVGLQAPRLGEGARADMVLVDPTARWTVDPTRLRSKSHNTPFGGQPVQGRVEMTVCEGRVVFGDAGGVAV